MSERVSEEEFKQIRELADKLEALAREARPPRWMIIAAMGIAVGEQYPDVVSVGEAGEIFSEWARFAFEHGTPVKKEDVQ